MTGVGGITTARTIPWWEPQMVGGEETRVRAVLRSNYLNDGTSGKFETRIAMFGVAARWRPRRHDSDFLALAAEEIGHGDSAPDDFHRNGQCRPSGRYGSGRRRSRRQHDPNESGRDRLAQERSCRCT